MSDFELETADGRCPSRQSLYSQILVLQHQMQDQNNKMQAQQSQVQEQASQMQQQYSIIQQQQQTIVNLQKLHSNTNTIPLAEASMASATSLQHQQLREKLPVLKEFNGNRGMWDEWHLAAVHKLTKDGEAIGSDLDQFMYIYARLEGDAVKMVSTTARTLSEQKKGNGLEFLRYMNTVFGDPNKKARAEQQLYSLKQKEREPFSSFLPRFETVLANAGWSCYSNSQKISLLKNDLSKEIRLALIGNQMPSSWSDFISYILTISSDIFALHQQFKPSPVIQQPSQQIKQNHNMPTNMDWEPIISTNTTTHNQNSRRATWVSKDTLAFRKRMVFV